MAKTFAECKTDEEIIDEIAKRLLCEVNDNWSVENADLARQLCIDMNSDKEDMIDAAVVACCIFMSLLSGPDQARIVLSGVLGSFKAVAIRDTFLQAEKIHGSRPH